MNRHILRVIGILFLQIIGFIFLWYLLAPRASVASARPRSASNVTLEEIDLGITQTLKEWYDD